MIQQRHPSARLKLTRIIQDDVKPILTRYRDLPIDWTPSLSQAQLAERLRGADVFVLPSLEEGLVRTALEAMACGLPVVITPHCGANDFVQAGVNGEVVPIRDPQAVAEAVLRWADRIMAAAEPPRRMIDPAILSYENFARNFIRQLEQLGFRER